MKKELTEFVAYMGVEKNYSKKTIVNYYIDINQYSNMMDIYNVKNISKSSIRLYLSKLKDSAIAATSRNRKLAAIRSFCRFLCDEGYIETNPSTDIHTAKIDRRLPVVMTELETGDIIDSARNLRDKTVLETLYGTGVRVSELVNMKISDIDFINRRIRVFGKGAKERIIPINRPSLDCISELINERDDTRLSEYVFPSPKNLLVPISTKAIYDIVLKYAGINKVSNISPHKFRHSYATHLHARGLDIADIKELLGHEDISTTTIYTKMLKENLSKGYQSAHPRG